MDFENGPYTSDVYLCVGYTSIFEFSSSYNGTYFDYLHATVRQPRGVQDKKDVRAQPARFHVGRHRPKQNTIVSRPLYHRGGGSLEERDPCERGKAHQYLHRKKSSFIHSCTLLWSVLYKKPCACSLSTKKCFNPQGVDEVQLSLEVTLCENRTKNHISTGKKLENNAR